MNIPKNKVEVCAYSLFSCISADLSGADRVELCASPWEGGTSPSMGLVHASLKNTNLEIHAMLRPRGGDFCYDALEKETMKYELESLLQAGVHGVVVGALTAEGEIDYNFLSELKSMAGSLSFTCHRAIDVAREPLDMMESLIDLGFLRILTSGQKNKAIDALENLEAMVQAAKARIQIMAGSGVNPANCLKFLEIGCDAVHLSARNVKLSAMNYQKPGISMGGVEAISEFEIAFADQAIIEQVVTQVRDFK